MTLTEINALVDILSVIKDGKYFAINPIAADLPEKNMLLYFAGKKRVCLFIYFKKLYSHFQLQPRF